MASLAAARRLSARLLAGRAAARSFSTSSHSLAAQNFIMPALSPTMTEGNIASWKVKEGEAFSAGDVLLEIETDKATMDVEAQEDGIMMKIMSQDGAKAVQVGTRIAVLAEAGDDISALELPAAETPAAQPASSTTSSSSTTATSTTESSSSSSSPQHAATTSSSASGSYEHSYPLLPSVGQLVKQNGLSTEDVSKIKGTGPQGRLLKGDVLAYLGAIAAERPEALSAHFHKLAHLDLTNIKVAPARAPPAPSPAIPEKKAAAAAPSTVEVQIPLSLTPLFHLREKLHKKIGAAPEVSDYITRAARLANQNLGPSAAPPTQNDLFDQILGLDSAKRARRANGRYHPTVSGIFTPPAAATIARPKPLDIINLLAAGPSPKKAPPKVLEDVFPGLPLDENYISVTVPTVDRKRALLFLERCRSILEESPEELLRL